MIENVILGGHAGLLSHNHGYMWPETGGTGRVGVFVEVPSHHRCEPQYSSWRSLSEAVPQHFNRRHGLTSLFIRVPELGKLRRLQLCLSRAGWRFYTVESVSSREPLLFEKPDPTVNNTSRINQKLCPVHKVRSYLAITSIKPATSTQNGTPPCPKSKDVAEAQAQQDTVQLSSYRPAQGLQSRSATKTDLAAILTRTSCCVTLFIVRPFFVISKWRFVAFQ